MMNMDHKCCSTYWHLGLDEQKNEAMIYLPNIVPEDKKEQLILYWRCSTFLGLSASI